MLHRHLRKHHLGSPKGSSVGPKLILCLGEETSKHDCLVSLSRLLDDFFEPLADTILEIRLSRAKLDHECGNDHDSRVLHTIRAIFSRSWTNVLLVFAPLGIAAHFAGLKNSTITFALNALAIVPLTALLTYATENVASTLGDGMGSLLNITFGNLVEIVILYVSL